jgi:LAS superfamily LD-carboxypeptidase LdcB
VVDLPERLLFGDPIQNQILGLTEGHLTQLDHESHFVLIHKEMKKTFMGMVDAANKDGIALEIASGYRSFQQQLLIFNKKFTGKKNIKDINNQVVDISVLSKFEILNAILLYSALPGGSRHHWGCDIDIYASNLLSDNQALQLEPWEYEKGGPMYRLNLWLDKYAGDFDFYRPYSSYSGGVAVEPWHLSYRPIAENYQNNFSLNALTTCLENSNIEGKETLLSALPEIVNRYMHCNIG